MNALGATLLQRARLMSGFDLLHFHHPPTELPANSAQQHLILINTFVPSDTYIEQVMEGQKIAVQMRLEDIMIMPAQAVSQARWDQAHSYLALCIEPTRLRSMALQSSFSVDLIPQLAITDPLLYQMGMALKSELDNPGFVGQLYIDSLLVALMAHLLQYYSTQKPFQFSSNGLSQQQLQQVVDYIQAHLAEDLTLTTLADLVQISPNYFSTQFKQSLGIAPHQYIIQQRIEQAQQQMKKGKLSISAIAKEVGFSDQSHFTRHFKRLVGVTPKQFLTHQ